MKFNKCLNENKISFKSQNDTDMLDDFIKRRIEFSHEKLSFSLFQTATFMLHAAALMKIPDFGLSKH